MGMRRHQQPDRMSFDESEEILAGRAAAHDDTGLAGALDGLRRSLRRAPDPGEQRRHLAAMAVAARTGPPEEPERGPIGLLGTHPVRRAVAGVGALALGLTAGLALAGALPGPAQDVVAQLAGHAGVDLPGGDDGEPPDGGDGATPAGHLDPDASPNAEHGEAVSAVAHDESLEGCEKGQTVSSVASSKSDDHRQDDGAQQPDDPCAQGEGPPSANGEDGGPPEGVPNGPPSSVPNGAPPEGVPPAGPGA